MTPMAQLFLATVAFVATHFVPSMPLRAALSRALGERGYLGLYSAVAFATLGWMIWAYLRAPLEPLWPGLRLLPAVAMPFALVLIACGVLSPNPTAVGQAKLLKAKVLMMGAGSIGGIAPQLAADRAAVPPEDAGNLGLGEAMSEQGGQHVPFPLGDLGVAHRSLPSLGGD